MHKTVVLISILFLAGCFTKLNAIQMNQTLICKLTNKLLIADNWRDFEFCRRLKIDTYATRRLFIQQLADFNRVIILFGEL